MSFTDIIIIIAISVALAVLTGILWAWRRRHAAKISRLNEQVVSIAESAEFSRRVGASNRGDALDQLGLSVNRLLDSLKDKEAQFASTSDLFRSMADTLPEVVLIHREEILFANSAAADLLGVLPKQLLGKAVTDLVRPAYRAMTRKLNDQRLQGDSIPDRYELQLISGDAQGLWVESAARLIDYQGEQAILTIARDISYRKSLEASLGRGKQQAQMTLESIGEGLVTTDAEGLIDYMNQSAEQMIGASRNDAVGKTFTDLVLVVDEVDRKSLGDPVRKSLDSGRTINLGRRALLLPRNGGKECSIELSASPIRAPGNKVSGAVILLHDVSELRGLTRQMSYQASHDALTGLINRREFERRVEEVLGEARTDDSGHVLCYLDLDRFKVVNDTCGHMAGDNMLREVAALIKEKVRDSDTVARIGGDEFGMLLIGCPLDKARQIGEDVCDVVRDYRFVWQDRIFNIGVSIGLVEIGRESGSLEDILGAADSASYVAKQQGRGRVHVYSARDEAVARQRGEIRWLQRLQKALKEDRFELYTQPIVSLGGRVRTGPAVEVLVRMQDDRGLHVSPRDFMSSAERYHLMASVDRWVVQTALAALGTGALKLPDERSCSINISGQTMGDESFLDFIVEVLDRTGVSPGQICFEVTESSVIRNIDHARRFIAVLHGMGCEFAMDDFGSGLGSIAHLRQVPMDFLKIDGSFIRDLSTDSVNRAMVDAMIKLGRSLNFRIIAEEVEDHDSFELVREMGIDFVQGYIIDRPQPLQA